MEFLVPCKFRHALDIKKISISKLSTEFKHQWNFWKKNDVLHMIIKDGMVMIKIENSGCYNSGKGIF